MSAIIKGRVWKYGDNINTDIISPGQYIGQPIELQAEHAMEAIDTEFYKKIRPGDILVAGNNFGSGSSRETAPRILKHLGISAIIANSFARIFYRNAMNLGLPVLDMTNTSNIQEGDIIEINLVAGKIFNHTQGTEYKGTKLPEHLIEMVEIGGLEPFLAKKLNITL
ncbi:3-isopropylmalate dehydratase [Bacillus sp. X1(2014)]|uniref:LeuD/DmdB family oxidoreductase small subunit n=1 Tax=Bacillus sp. X1(2014) TaxID=1565991 RepID=UPI001642A99C|nr:3-isopropylmalate dehydratase [Bacillus sp. X1(2014)]